CFVVLCSLVLDLITLYLCFFFFLVTATTEFYTLSLHDALPISLARLYRGGLARHALRDCGRPDPVRRHAGAATPLAAISERVPRDRKSTRLNSSHEWISYAVFCLKKKNTIQTDYYRKNLHQHER